MANNEIYRIGRGSDMDIQISDASVSRAHAELIVTHRGAYHLTDCNSRNGSHVARDGEWVSIRQEFVSATQGLSLGNYQTTVQQLIAMVDRGNRGSSAGAGRGNEGSGAGADRRKRGSDRERSTKDKIQGPVGRNPGTGDIIQKEA